MDIYSKILSEKIYIINVISVIEVGILNFKINN